MPMRTAPPPSEIELKLRLPPGSHAALERLPVLQAARAEKRREVTTYFDTEDHALAARGFSLRVRASGDRRVQTLKLDVSDGGAAGRRGEWEWPITSDQPELDHLAETPARAIVAELAGRLRPLFATEIDRCARVLRLDGKTEVEASIDRGAIVADTRREPVDELELELKAGSLAPLYRFAIDLHEAVPMQIARESKAARGYRLRAGSAPRASHAAKLDLSPDTPANVALRDIIASGLRQITDNVAAADAADPEGIHQLRVGLRRLRSALVMFRPLLEPHASALFEDELRQLGRVFGARRDRDVLCLEILPEAARWRDGWVAGWVDRLRPLAEADRAASLAPAQEALRSAGLTSLVLGLAAWCEDGLEQPRLLGETRTRRRLDKVAPALLDRLAGKVARRRRHLDTPERLHKLRRSLKKLRYATEFVGGTAKTKAVRRYRQHCKTLQKLLGTINDAHTTRRLVAGLIDARSTELAPAVAALASWSNRRESKALKRLDTALDDFRAAKPFWR